MAKTALITLALLALGSACAAPSSTNAKPEPAQTGFVWVGKHGAMPTWVSANVYKLGTLDGCSFYEVDGRYEHVFMRCPDGPNGYSTVIPYGKGGVRINEGASK